MPLIEPVTSPSSPVAQAKRQLDQALQSAYVTIRNALTTGKRVTWENPRVNPQDLFNAYGSDAVALLQVTEAAKQLLLLVGDDFGPILPANKTITPNADGTVTVGDAT